LPGDEVYVKNRRVLEDVEIFLDEEAEALLLPDTASDIADEDGIYVVSSVASVGLTQSLPSILVPTDMGDQTEVRLRAGDYKVVKDPLPSWAYSRDGVTTKAQLVLGACVPVLRSVAVMTLVCLVTVFVIVLKGSSVQGSYPRWIWFIVLPVAVTKIYSEFQFVSLTIVPYTISVISAGLRPFKLAGVPLSCRVWLFGAAFRTFTAFLDQITDSIFCGTTISTMNSGDEKANEMEQVWAWTFKQSVILDKLPDVSVCQTIWLIWCIALVQHLAALTITMRKEELKCDGTKRNRLGKSGKGHALLDDTNIHNGIVGFSLAEGANLGSAMGMVITDAQAGIQHYTPFMLHSQGLGGSHSLQKALALGEQMTHRIFLLYLGENCLQLYMQNAVLMIRLFLEKAVAQEDHIEWTEARVLQLFSLGLSFWATFVGVLDVRHYVVAVKEVVDKANDHYERLSDIDKQVLGKVKRSKVIVLIGTALLCYCLLLSLAKLIAGFYICEGVMWNLTGILSPSHGCVDMHELAEAIVSNRHANS